MRTAQPSKNTCLSCQSPFLGAGPCQQQVPYHHLIAHLPLIIMMCNHWLLWWVITGASGKSSRSTWTASRRGASLLLSVVLLCTFTLIEIRKSRLSRSLCKSKKTMKPIWKVFYLDDGSVQIILSPRVWLFSCSGLQFKDYLKEKFFSSFSTMIKGQLI